ncbi:hypothetical protein FSP39_006517 [Pinctada imbricata]|uniref:Uncharacterized protein n=1 Tax=Pinctada imbricata TaxID=66713 RepID=A0AA88XKQ2_PINIB|nr:hypothetical protein FSP39_006517 [Pinctada imbricata]
MSSLYKKILLASKRLKQTKPHFHGAIILPAPVLYRLMMNLERKIELYYSMLCPCRKEEAISTKPFLARPEPIARDSNLLDEIDRIAIERAEKEGPLVKSNLTFIAIYNDTRLFPNATSETVPLQLEPKILVNETITTDDDNDVVSYNNTEKEDAVLHRTISPHGILSTQMLTPTKAKLPKTTTSSLLKEEQSTVTKEETISQKTTYQQLIRDEKVATLVPNFKQKSTFQPPTTAQTSMSHETQPYQKHTTISLETREHQVTTRLEQNKTNKKVQSQQIMYTTEPKINTSKMSDGSDDANDTVSDKNAINKDIILNRALSSNGTASTPRQAQDQQITTTQLLIKEQITSFNEEKILQKTTNKSSLNDDMEGSLLPKTTFQPPNITQSIFGQEVDSYQATTKQPSKETTGHREGTSSIQQNTTLTSLQREATVKIPHRDELTTRQTSLQHETTVKQPHRDELTNQTDVFAA